MPDSPEHPPESPKLPDSAPPLPTALDPKPPGALTAAATSMWNAAALNRMAILLFVLISVNALLTVTLASLQGVDLATTDRQTKWMIGMAIAANWTGTMIAFFRQTLTKIAKGESPLTATDPQ